MAISVSSREFLHNASKYIRKIRAGKCDRITVLYHGVPAVVVTAFRRPANGAGRGRGKAPGRRGARP